MEHSLLRRCKLFRKPVRGSSAGASGSESSVRGSSVGASRSGSSVRGSSVGASRSESPEKGSSAGANLLESWIIRKIVVNSHRIILKHIAYEDKCNQSSKFDEWRALHVP